MTGDAATILIVEDEPPIRRLLRSILTAHGPTWCCSISACPTSTARR